MLTWNLTSNLRNTYVGVGFIDIVNKIIGVLSFTLCLIRIAHFSLVFVLAFIRICTPLCRISTVVELT